MSYGWSTWARPLGEDREQAMQLALKWGVEPERVERWEGVGYVAPLASGPLGARSDYELVHGDFVLRGSPARWTVGKGGPGSGNFGHAGRPGEVGGSAPSEGGLPEHLGWVEYRRQQERNAAPKDWVVTKPSHPNRGSTPIVEGKPIPVPPSASQRLRDQQAARDKELKTEQQQVKELVIREAKALDFPMDRIDVYEAASGPQIAEYDPITRRISIYADEVMGMGPKYTVRSVLAHEIEHAKFHEAFPDQPKLVYPGDTQLGPSLTAFVKENGGLAAFATTGPKVSEYAAKHWRRLANEESATLLAINETLAEVERKRVKSSDNPPTRAEWGKKYPAPWGKLYSEVVRKAG